MENQLFGVPSLMWLFEIWPFLRPRDIVTLVTASKAIAITALPILSRQIATLLQEITFLHSQMPVHALAEEETRLAPLVQLIKAWKFSKTDWTEVRAYPRPPLIVVTALQVAFGAVLGIPNFDKSDIWKEMSRTSLLEEYSDHLLSRELSLSCIRKLAQVAETVDRDALARFSSICGSMFAAACAKLEVEKRKREFRPMVERMRVLEKRVADIETVVSGFTATLCSLERIRQA